MSILNALLQGIVQGLTEFLPISSSGHLSLIQHFTGQSGEAGGLFAILLHLGTLVAVFLAFYRTIFELILEFFRMLKDLFTGKFTLKEMNAQRRMVILLIVSLIPLALVVGLKDFYQSVSTDNDIIVEGVCFLVTALLLFLADHVVKGHKTAKDMRYSDALVVGVVQAVAPLPGISRSGSTISAGLLMGLEKQYAVAFSFIMGIPAVLGANLLEIKDVIGADAGMSTTALLVGMVAAFVFGLIAIKMVNWLVKSDKFKWFALYTFVLGIAVIGVGLFEKISGTTIYSLLHP